MRRARARIVTRADIKNCYSFDDQTGRVARNTADCSDCHPETLRKCWRSFDVRARAIIDDDATPAN